MRTSVSLCLRAYAYRSVRVVLRCEVTEKSSMTDTVVDGEEGGAVAAEHANQVSLGEARRVNCALFSNYSSLLMMTMLSFWLGNPFFGLI